MGTGGEGGGTAAKGQRCSCTKDDFLPEESFQSWENYGRGLREKAMLLRDRVLTRSLERTELTGIFVLTGQEAKEAAGPAVVLSFAVSGVSAMLSVFSPDVPTSFLTNNAFHVLHSTRLHPEPAPDVEEEEEEAVPVPAAPEAPAPLHIASPFDHLVQRFDQWEARFDSYVVAQEQQHNEDIQRFADYAAQQQQQHDQDMAWFGAHFQAIHHYFYPPPPPPSSDQDPPQF
ncbi:hypothetical protein IEQ34_013656 [Dendrobium chrysotoxum]|uniref:Uncharacterized protein n=1 Tax=Dendrobium chrysotoxum TaxID=161865 RepID=A0AAV7GP45_DENCH|nr:hypothetical protein IEQ34_013656 [Dendrobium chrysotoxum]